MNSQTTETIWNNDNNVGLSANTEPQNPVVYHHVPYQKVIFLGYTMVYLAFSATPMD
jgi:hypothetical protein